MPVAAVANVVGEEKTRHGWSDQHKRVWLKPSILAELQNLQNIWSAALPSSWSGSILTTQYFHPQHVSLTGNDGYSPI